MPAFPVGIPLGPWTIHPHFLFEALAYTIGFQWFLRLRRRTGDHLDTVNRGWVVAAAMVGAVAGAKGLFWLIQAAESGPISVDPANPLGGKTVVGAIVGGHLAVEFAKRRLGIESRTGDLFAPPMAAGIAVGRIGCFLTGLSDRTYGAATSLPWGVDFGDGVARHPTQLYEIAFLVALAVLLHRMASSPVGTRWRTFFVAYAGWRLVVGFIQPLPGWLGMSPIQWVCLAVVVWWLHHTYADPQTARAAPIGG